VIVFFVQFYTNYKSRQKFGASFKKYSSCINFDRKIGWATFWVIFSQTHLVTLVPGLVMVSLSGWFGFGESAGKQDGETKKLFPQKKTFFSFSAEH
jgi:hypothetical protein